MTRKRQNCIMGIDPGLLGAVCVYDPKFHEIPALWNIPISKEIKKRKVIREVDVTAFRRAVLKAVEDYNITHIVVEDVHASTQMGVSSAFKFGRTFGIIEAVADAAEVVKVEYVTPARWKARMMVSSDKKQTIEKAISVFGAAPWFSGKSVRDGQAEAALIAYYGAKDLVTVPVEDDEDDPLA